jgi:hypothetical protein
MTYLTHLLAIMLGAAVGYFIGKEVEYNAWVRYLAKYRTNLKAALIAEIVAKEVYK